VAPILNITLGSVRVSVDGATLGSGTFDLKSNKTFTIYGDAEYMVRYYDSMRGRVGRAFRLVKGLVQRLGPFAAPFSHYEATIPGFRAAQQHLIRTAGSNPVALAIDRAANNIFSRRAVADYWRRFGLDSLQQEQLASDIAHNRAHGGYVPREASSFIPRSLRTGAARAYGQISKRLRYSRVGRKVRQAKALYTVGRKMYSNAIPWFLTGVTKGKWMYPGSRYIGPGNRLNEGKPLSYHDRLAYQHDHQYSFLQSKNINPYFTFNEADREMLSKVDTTNDEGMAEWLGMSAKRVFRSNRQKVPRFREWENKYGGR